MSRTTPVQTSFNGGEVSRRLSARIDQSIYQIALEEMTGWAPLLEGPAEAMPGTIHVAQAPGPFRPLRFQYNTTQGHVIEAGAAGWRVYTNDALITDGGGVPVSIASPYSWPEIQALRTHQNYDVLYCLLRSRAPKQFQRDGAAAFSFADLELKDGPFEDRNDDKDVKVAASAMTGSVTLSATDPIFAATDVGSLFQMEAGDFGDIPAWEPGITVTLGQLLTFGERVYRVAGLGAASRTGGLQPVHTEGVEWDGMGRGTDINDKDAPGVQLEYVHDKIGILKITGYTNPTTVTATVLRHLPFSSVNNNYGWTGGYYSGGWSGFVPSGVAYAYGTWRWRFGAFSDTRGWPECACVWNERLWLGKDDTVYGSAAADLKNFAVFNELGELTNDMALTVRMPDPDSVLHMVGDDGKLLIYTGAGTYALGPAGAATGIGPNNRRIDPQNSRSSCAIAPVQIDSRTVHIDRSRTRIHESDFDPNRNAESGVELTRFARHISANGRQFTGLAVQTLPFNHLWAARDDGTLACAVYLPEEQALGWANRPLADGVLAKDICAITDPAGEHEQVWIAATYGGEWHMLRMAEWRADGEYDLTPIMLDMAASYDGAPVSSLVHPVLRSRTIEIVADGAWLTVETDEAGRFDVPDASKVVAGLPYRAVMTDLPIESGGDNGPARGKTARIGRAWVEVETSRGLRFGAMEADLEDLEQLTTDSIMDEGFAVESGFADVEGAGDYTRRPRLTIERVAPFQATVLAWAATLEVAQK